MEKFYAGVGSRKTTSVVLEMMTNFAQNAEHNGWTLRSGGAKGADAAFEAGVSKLKDIYLPWGYYNQNPSLYVKQSDEAFKIAADHHHEWKNLSQGVQKLHARNVHIVLGSFCNDPVKFMVAWTEKGKIIGGTGMALRLAETYKIPVFNLGTDIDVHQLFAIVTEGIES
jgi:hypothetical protein